MAKRTVWTLVAQGISSLSNVALVIVAARSISVDEFAELSVALAVYSIWIGVSRSLLSDPLMINHSSSDSGTASQASGAAFSAALGITIPLSALLILGQAIGLPIITATLATLGIVMPIVAAQDLLRHVALVVRRPQVAAAMDLVWLIAIVIFALQMPSGAGPSKYLLFWGLSAGGSLLVGMVLLRLIPLRGGRQHFRGSRSVSVSATIEFLCLAGAGQGVILVVAGVGAPALAAGLRAAGVLFGPLGVLNSGGHSAIVAEGTRIRESGLASLRRVAIWVPAALAASMITWAVLLSLLPDTVGEGLLGDTWTPTREILVRYGISYAGIMAAFALGAVLRALGQTERSVRAAVPMLLLAVAAAWLFTARGPEPLTNSLILATWVGVGFYIWQVRAALHSAAAEADARSY